MALTPNMSYLIGQCGGMKEANTGRSYIPKNVGMWIGVVGILAIWIGVAVWGGMGFFWAARDYVTTDGRVLRGRGVLEEEGSVVIQVEKDSRGEVPAGERILVLRRDLKEVK